MSDTTKTIATWFEKTKIFFREVETEMKKVTWPTQPQVKNYITIVFIACFALAVVIGMFDWVLGQILAQITGLRG